MSDAIVVKQAILARRPERWELPDAPAWSHYFLVAVVVLGVTLPFLFLKPVIGPRAIGLLYLVVVVLMGLFVGRGPTLLAAALSGLMWDFFFLPPVANLRISSVEDAILFATYFVVALVLGQLTARISAQEKAQRQGEARATALYQLTRDLVAATGLDQLVQHAVQHTSAAFGARIAVLLAEPAGRLSYHAHPSSTYEITGPEQPVAGWVFQEGLPAGKSMERFPEADTLFLPLTSGSDTMGVMGLSFDGPRSPQTKQRELLATFAQHIALALDRHRLRADSERSRLLAESERLSKALLNSMSHEIRTPLAAIKSATGNLLELKAPQLSEPQQEMVAEIQEATERLNRLVGKVLDISRLESGHVKPKLTLCDVNDLVHVALKSTRKELAQHKVAVELSRELPLVRADFVLLQEALMNLLSNAGCHTPAGTDVQVSARAGDGALFLSVADRGPGIVPEALSRIFDKFFRAPGAPTGGTGLGLSLVKGFVEAQGGQVKAENRYGGGALFTIRLPL